jgi:aminoglycoside phosphotransferase (APT) family kinase protein
MNSDASVPRAGAPEAQITIDATLVRRLLREQHPDLAGLSLQAVGGGWDNEMFRLGESLAVRLPRRAPAAPLLLKEQRWLPELSSRLPIAVPVPTRIGQPTSAFPWGWSIVPWFSGFAADLAASALPPPATLGDFLRVLHAPAPPDAPRNPVRGCALADRAGAVAVRLERLRGHSSFASPALVALWRSALAAPVDLSAKWLHGDLHPRNLLVADARWSAVIDWGDLGAGDPATDLAALWMLWPTQGERAAALAAYGSVSRATLVRARGWALLFATLMGAAGQEGDARFAAIGAWTCERLLAESAAEPPMG